MLCSVHFAWERLPVVNAWADIIVVLAAAPLHPRQAELALSRYYLVAGCLRHATDIPVRSFPAYARTSITHRQLRSLKAAPPEGQVLDWLVQVWTFMKHRMHHQGQFVDPQAILLVHAS